MSTYRASHQATATVRRYVGGLKNQDGAVTWTTGVTASSPLEARQQLTRYFARRLGRTVMIDQVGIVMVRDMAEQAEADAQAAAGADYDTADSYPRPGCLHEWRNAGPDRVCQICGVFASSLS